MKAICKFIHLGMAFIVCTCALSKAAEGASPVPPFEYVRTILPSGESSFGRALADFGGNVLVGASGKAYLYNVQTGSLIRSYDHAGGAFNDGNWLTAYGDKIAIGTPNSTGSVQVFNSSTGQLLSTYNGSEAGDRFGWSLASNGTLLFVGAPELRNGSTYFGSGKVVVVNSVGSRRTILNPEPTGLFDEESFGYDIGAIGNDLYVGALYDQDGGKVWRMAADTGAVVTKINNPDGALGNGGGAQFGESLDVAGNYLLVGANQSSASGMSSSGAAYLFDRTTGNLLHTFFDPHPGALDNFGIDVALVGNFAVVGAHNDNDGKSNGAVFVYDLITGQYVQTIETPSSSSTFFGLKVQNIGGNWLAISETTASGKVNLYRFVPEPATFAMLLSAIVVLVPTRRSLRRANRKHPPV
jgi:WD40 repeat protein